MSFKAPYLSKDELRRRADQFLATHNTSGTIPVPIEFIIESDFAMDIVTFGMSLHERSEHGDFAHALRSLMEGRAHVRPHTIRLLGTWGTATNPFPRCSSGGDPGEKETRYNSPWSSVASLLPASESQRRAEPEPRSRNDERGNPS